MSSLGLQSGLGASISMLSTYPFPLILGITYRFKGKNRVKTTFLDRNVDPRTSY